MFQNEKGLYKKSLDVETWLMKSTLKKTTNVVLKNLKQYFPIELSKWIYQEYLIWKFLRD